MQILKTKWFYKWAVKEGLVDQSLVCAVNEMEQGLVDANLGGQVFKKRVALPGRGKRGGSRTLLAYRQTNKAFFIFGFAKNERANINDKELKALRLLATELLSYDERALEQAIVAGELFEVNQDD